ncbi:MAG: serine hydrolase domain-containing protein, partial [Dehalococcoidia bacterium]|nr:serine hydrolase domain-containing protein [Dehalococcoidia bacterium]
MLALPVFVLATALVVAGIVWTGCSSGSESGAESDPGISDIAIDGSREARRAVLQTALDEWRESELITGVSMSVFSPATGQIDLASGLAKRSIDPDRFPDEALTADRPMFAADLTHTLVAAVIIQLAGQGALELGSPIDTWFPDITNSEQITVRNLLVHTSGVPIFYTEEFLDVLYEQEPNLAQSPDDVIAVADAVSGGSYFAPGTQYGYSKTNYLLLGRIIEQVTGEPLEVELRSRFFDPLGLNNTYLVGREKIPGSTPLGYEYAGPDTDAPTAVDGHVPQTPTVSIISAEWASGGLVSTPGDLIKVVRAIFDSPGLADIAREMLRVAEHPAQESEAARVDSGAGVFVWTEDGRPVIGQFGFIYPFSAQFTF